MGSRNSKAWSYSEFEVSDWMSGGERNEGGKCTNVGVTERMRRECERVRGIRQSRKDEGIEGGEDIYHILQ